MNDHKTSKIFGFRHSYPQSFLDELAKAYGFKWTKVEWKLYDGEIEVRPLPPPTGELYYCEFKYATNIEPDQTKENKNE